MFRVLSRGRVTAVLSCQHRSSAIPGTQIHTDAILGIAGGRKMKPECKTLIRHRCRNIAYVDILRYSVTKKPCTETLLSGRAYSHFSAAVITTLAGLSHQLHLLTTSIIPPLVSSRHQN